MCVSHVVMTKAHLCDLPPQNLDTTLIIKQQTNSSGETFYKISDKTYSGKSELLQEAGETKETSNCNLLS